MRTFYRLAEKCARTSGGWRWIFLVTLFFVAHYWISSLDAYLSVADKGFFSYAYKNNAYQVMNFLFRPETHEETTVLWFKYRWILCTASLLFYFLVHYFLACLIISRVCFNDAKQKISTGVTEIMKNPDSSILGMDLVTGHSIGIEPYVEYSNVEVIAGDEILRNALHRIIKVDIQNKPDKTTASIVIIAPKGEKDLLEEVTMILKDRKQNETKSFYYYSLNDPKRSVTYSPFTHLHHHLLRSWLKLEADSKEALIFEGLIHALFHQPKFYELDDILLLLENKKAIFALNQKSLMEDYLLGFDLLKKYRFSLTEKLIRFGKDLNLDAHPITQGFPLLVEVLFRAHEHLYIEIEDKPNQLTQCLLSELSEVINDRNKYAGTPKVYLIHPEKIDQIYSLETYFKPLNGRVQWRILSNEVCFSCKGAMHTKIYGQEVLKAIAFKGKRKELYERVSDNKPLLSEETFRTTTAIINQLNLKNIAQGVLESPKEKVATFIQLPPPEIDEKMEYVPYQNPFEPKHILNLRKHLDKVKYVQSQFDPRVADIVHDLKTKNC